MSVEVCGKVGAQRLYTAAMKEVQEQFDVILSGVLKKTCHASARRWRGMCRLVKYDVNGELPKLSNGVNFPYLLQSWEGTGEVTNGFQICLGQGGDEHHAFRLHPQLLPRLLACGPAATVPTKATLERAALNFLHRLLQCIPCYLGHRRMRHP